jgi:hypothetical protein
LQFRLCQSRVTADFYTVGYYIGHTMNFEIVLKNTGGKNFNDLDVAAVEEYSMTGSCDRWWFPEFKEVDYIKGQPLPGDTRMSWRDVELFPYYAVKAAGCLCHSCGNL